MRKLLLVPMILIGSTLTAATPLDITVGDRDMTAERPLLSPYRLAAITRGEAVTKVVAAGTVQPVSSVVVGSQVSGQVKEVLVDHNDAVTQGQPIARIDPHLFMTRVEQARSEVDVASHAVEIARSAATAAIAIINKARAERSRAEADAKRSAAIVDNTRRRLDRKSLLMKGGASSVSETDDARAAYEVALAEAGSAAALVTSRDAELQDAEGELAVARDRVGHAEAQVRRNEAALRQAEADLERTIIRAPADGIVIDRSVAAGQTVAASFTAPSLFTIGDLSAVAVEVAIDEADIGRILSGQEATFSVDAYPDKVFRGRITQVRRSPHTQETVVTYAVILEADNKDLLLFPGMTARAEIVAGRSADALQVPTAALRYRPTGVPLPSGSHVWVFDGHSIHPVAVRVGTSEADRTEIVGAVEAGQDVVVGDAVDETVARQPGVAWRQIGIQVAGWMEPVQAALTGLARR